MEAEVDEDEDEEEEEDEYANSASRVLMRLLVLTSIIDEFIADAGIEGEEDYDAVRRTADHARYDRRVREMDDRDLEQVAEDISQRYRRTAVRYTGEMSDVPQRLLMPSVHDANLWQVRVKVSFLTRLWRVSCTHTVGWIAW